MRKEYTMRLQLLLVIPIILLIAVACSSPRPARVVDKTMDETKVAEIGESAAMTLIQGLIGRLNAAMNEGTVAAFEFCAREAQSLTATIQQELGSDLQVKRTSFQYRNPANAPDEYETAALQYFQDALAERGSLPTSYIQMVNANEYRYYKPLVMAAMCLNCHGDPASFDPALQQQLQATYPEDKAVGYKEGDFRGVVRVSIPASLVR